MRTLLAAVIALALGAVLLPERGGPSALAEDTGSFTTSVTANPLAVTLDLSAHNVRVGSRLDATGAVTNHGSTPLAGALVTLLASPVGLRIEGGPNRLIIVLRGGATEQAGWRLCALSPGNYLLVARVTAVDFTGNVSAAESAAELLKVSPSRKRCCQGGPKFDQDAWRHLTNRSPPVGSPCTVTMGSPAPSST